MGSSASQTLPQVELQPQTAVLRSADEPGSFLDRSHAKGRRPWVDMKLIDVTVPLDARLPTYPGNTPLILEANKCLTRGDSSNVSTLHLSAHAGTHCVGVTSSGAERLIASGMLCLPPRIVGADGPPARVRLQSQ